MAEERHKGFTKKRIVLCAAVVLFAAVIWLLVANHDSTPMPVYQGKTARQWLYSYSRSHGNEEWLFNYHGGPGSESWIAFEHMGSNAVPFLIHELERKDYACNWIYPKLPTALRNHISCPDTYGDRWPSAANALAAVNSRTAIPPLRRLLPEGDKYQRMNVLWTLDSLVKPDDTNLIPQLKICINAPDSDICFSTAAILIKLRSGELAIPALTNCLVHGDRFVLTRSSELLEKIDSTNATKWREMLPHGESSQGSQQAIAPK